MRHDPEVLVVTLECILAWAKELKHTACARLITDALDEYEHGKLEADNGDYAEGWRQCK